MKHADSLIPLDKHQEIAAERLQHIGILTGIGGRKRVSEIQGNSAYDIWNSLLKDIVPQPYRRCIFNKAETMEKMIDQDVSLFERIGKGGTATIDCGWSWQTSEPLALKTMLYKLSDYCSLVRQEEKVLTTLGVPDGQLPIAPKFNFSKSDVKMEPVPPHLGMEYIDGVSVQSIRASWENAPLSYKVHALAEISDLLSRLHTHHGLQHRDFNLDNCMLDVRRGLHLLIDFGTGTNGDQSIDDVISFTERYAPPERIRDGSAAKHSAMDIYSFGASAHFMQTGIHPSKNIASDFQLLTSSCPQAMANFIMRMRSDNPDDRPTAEQCRDFFLQWHINMNAALLPKKNGQEIRSPQEYLSHLAPSDRMLIYGKTTAKDDPLREYRESSSSVKLSPQKLIDGPLRTIFQNKKSTIYSLS